MERSALEKIEVVGYELKPREQIIADVLKHFLLLNSEKGRRALRGIVEPRVFKVDFEGGGRGTTLLKTDIDGKKLAELIDTAAAFSLFSLKEYNVDIVLQTVAERINGKHFVETMSVEFLEFLTDCYRVVYY